MEEGKVAEWEAPCHQYALMMVGGEEQLMMVERGGNGVFGSGKNINQDGRNITGTEMKNSGGMSRVVAELGINQAAFLFFSSMAFHQFTTNSFPPCCRWRVLFQVGNIERRLAMNPQSG